MDLCAIILTGASPGHFVTHFDPEQIRAGLDDPEQVAARGPVRNVAVNKVLEELARLPVPVIAALNGDAMGFGFELALACDLRIGQRGDFRYGLPEVRLGIIPGAGGTQRLARLVGLSTALNLVLRARVVDPELAMELGLLTELHDDALAASRAIATEFAALPRSAVGVAKRVLHLGVDAALATGLNIESEGSVRSKLSPMAAAALDDYLLLPLAARRTWLDGQHQDEVRRG
jgi:enoyl-CoA hydratase